MNHLFDFFAPHRLIYKSSTGLIQKDAARFAQVGSLDPEVEPLFEGLELPEDVIRRARATVGMTLETMHEVDRNLTPEQKKRRKELAILRDNITLVLAAELPERVFRPDSPEKQLSGLAEVEAVTGVPKSLPFLEHVALRLAASPLARLPFVRKKVAGAVRKKVLRQLAGFAKVFENESAAEVVQTLRAEEEKTGIGHAINFAVEAATCKVEADNALNEYKKYIETGAKNIAIKPTALVGLSTAAIATKRSTEELTKALKVLFQAAADHPLPNGQTCDIRIDSERSDLTDMTRDAVLAAAKKYPHVRITIAVQSYFQDAEQSVLNPVLQASEERVAAGGMPLGVSLVCGANEYGEKRYASEMGFDDTPLVGSRKAAHANYMRLMAIIMESLKAGTLRLNLGCMNLLTLIHHLNWLAENGVLEAVENLPEGFLSVSMLEGMTGNEIFPYFDKKYNLKKVAKFKYTPVTYVKTVYEFLKYNLRRLEEIAGGDEKTIANYLGILAKYGVDSEEWRKTQLENGYLAALAEYAAAIYPLKPGIRSNRGEDEPIVEPTSLKDFRITPVLNAGSKKTRQWVDERIEKVRQRTSADADAIDLPFAKKSGGKVRKKVKIFGRTLPEVELADVEYATQEDINQAFEIAGKHNESIAWRKRSFGDRIGVIQNALGELRKNRGTIVEALMANISKAITEGDPEVNETMDFNNLAVLHGRELLKRDNLDIGTEGDGVAVVICPKNFPIAIPWEQVIKRLMAGYRVIIKPSTGEGEEAILPTWELVKCLHAAGVPKEALIFLPCDNDTANHLTRKAERVDYTGSTGTAAAIHNNNPRLDFLGETGAKANTAIIDSTTDLKEAALKIVHSVCLFAGQKCSKLRLVIATKDVNMEKLKWHIVEIMKAMLVGSALIPHVDVTPLSKEPKPESHLYKAIKELLPGEEPIYEHPSLEGPRLRWIENPEQFNWQTLQEIFASVVTLAQINGGVEEAVDIVDRNPSLTGVLFSQDHQHAIPYALANWRQVGNLKINDKSTGALASEGFGDGPGDTHRGAHGLKSGTIESLLMRAHVTRVPGKHAKYDKAKIKKDPRGLKRILEQMERQLKSGQYDQMPDEIATIINMGWSYLYEHQTYFSQKREAPHKIEGQDDWIESFPVGAVMVRLNPKDNLMTITGKIFAVIASGNPLRLSMPAAMRQSWQLLQNDLGIDFRKTFPQVSIVYEEDSQIAEQIRAKAGGTSSEKFEFIACGNRNNVSDEIFAAAAEANLYIDCRPVSGDGLNDLITQYRQRSVRWVHHRGGNSSYHEMWRKKKSGKIEMKKAA